MPKTCKEFPRTGVGKECSPAWKIFDITLLSVCLSILALRCTLTESPNTAVTTMMGSGYDAIYSATASTVLILAAICWLISIIWRKAGRYRFTFLEPGILLFFIAGIIGCFTASDKRAAITDFVAIFSSMAAAVILVQLLNSPAKRMILLMAVISLGFVNFVQSLDEAYSSNQFMIEQYKQNPDEQLQRLGIEKNTLAHFMYEHRLFSKDIRGYFTTGNSAGSFIVLCIFIGAGIFTAELRRIKNADKFSGAPCLAMMLYMAALIWAAVLMHSKGANASLILLGVAFVICSVFGRLLYKIRFALLIVVLAVFFCAVGFVIYQGKTHGGLHGWGNSMFVRWQYWQSAWRIFTEHCFTGIGGGNFAKYYLLYKDPAAIETVKDPHCFILSLISQYGILGTVGFLAAMLVPVFKIIFYPAKQPGIQPSLHKAGILPALAYISIFITAVMLIVRPVLIQVEYTPDTAARIYVYGMLYFLPVAAFAFSMWFLARALFWNFICEPSICAIICGIAAVVLHNTIDFAIFEPGVSLAFWSVIAYLAAQTNVIAPDSPLCAGINASPAKNKPGFPLKIFLTSAMIIFAWLIIKITLLPVARTCVKMESAKSFANNGQLEKAVESLNGIENDDILASETLRFRARLNVAAFVNTGKTPEIYRLHCADDDLQLAAKRNPADYDIYSDLADVQRLLADNIKDNRLELLQKAYNSSKKSLECYPGNSEELLKFAEIAELVGKTGDAIWAYRKAVEIEDAFRRQFAEMYPGRPVFSRMGELNYQQTIEKIKELAK